MNEREISVNKYSPEITVIIPVYNNEKYIRRCMNSILSQSYDDYEIILIDDGSQDGSGKICDDFAAEVESISVIHQKNKGLASSRKVGVEAAMGKYITFVDSDDYIAPDMLKILHDNILDFDMVSCCFTIVTGSTEKVQDTFKEEYVDFYDNREMIHAYFDKKYLNGSACAMLVKRELYGRIDMCEGAVPGEEICTTLQLYQIAKSIRALPDPLYYYWQNEEGISHGGYTQRHRKGLMNYVNLCDSMVEQFPEIRVKIGAYFCEFEMAVMTAMCRNNVYDIEVIHMLQNHLKKHFSELVINKGTALYYKVSAALIIINYKWFAFIFKRIRKSVGR